MRSSSRAKTRNVEAYEPLVIHCLVPVMRPSARACASRSRRSPSRPRSARTRRSPRRRRARARTREPCASSGSVHALVCTATVTPTPGVGARELLEHEHVGEEVGARAAVLLGHADAHQPELAELREHLAREACARGPSAAACGRDLLVGEAARERRGSRAARRSARAGSSRAPAAAPASRCRRPRPAPSAAAATRRRRPSRSKRRTSQPSSRATRASSASGLTATGWPTARSIGRSDSESRVAPTTPRGRSPRARPARGSPAPCPRGR